MICHNCGSEVPSGNVCSNCGADMVLMKKARNVSLRQYNKGVSLAKEGDYSGAIACLNRCVLIDKRNYVARNLLGIAYYQVGMVSDALKQWVISASVKSKGNPAEKYISSLQKNARLLEKYNDAIIMYNKALRQFKQGSGDLAVIQLKKAVSLNSSFVEAYNLLTAYYLSVNDKAYAKEYASAALKCDKRNARAMYYLSIISSGAADYKETETVGRKTEDGYVSKKSLRDYIRPELVTFIIGAAAAAAVVFTLVMPTISDEKNRKINNLESEVARLKDENENGTSAFALKYSKLEDENKALKAENDSYKSEDNKRQQKIDYQLAEAKMLTGSYEEAAQLISGLDSANFTAEENGKIDEMKAVCYAPAAEAAYKEGGKKFSAGDMSGAKELLLKSLDYTDKGDFSDDVLYLLGQIAEADGDSAQAAEYYGRVVNEFSSSNVYKQSEEKLNNILVSGQ